MLGRDQAGAVVGQIALSDLSPGTLITTDDVAASAAIDPGDGVVGLALDPGEYPTLSLRPGDLVRVVQVPGSTETDTADVVLAAEAEIVDVGPIGVQQQLFVSLAVDTSEADAIARAGARDREHGRDAEQQPIVHHVENRKHCEESSNNGCDLK